MDLIKQAYLRVERGPRRSVVTRAQAVSPLALRTPQNHGHAAWVFTSSHGGGLVSGDRTSLDATVEQGATLVLATQASTKAYRARRPEPGEIAPTSQLSTAVRVAADGLACLLPDPFVAFAGARVEQRLTITLAAGGSVLVWDPLTAGRVARGEAWAFEHVLSSVVIDGPDGRLVTEAVRLRPKESLAFAGGDVRAFAFLALLGPRVAPLAKRLLERTAQAPARDGGTVFVAHPFARDGFEGAIVRVACDEVATLGIRLRDWLSELPALLGDDILARRAF